MSKRFKTPSVGIGRWCLICGGVKPWGIHDPRNDATICVECRDMARDFPAILRTVVDRGHAIARREDGNGVPFYEVGAIADRDLIAAIRRAACAGRSTPESA